MTRESGGGSGKHGYSAVMRADTMHALALKFQETAQAHHKAFEATDGADPDWPLWYADHLLDWLNEKLGADLSKTDLVVMLTDLDEEHEARCSGEAWPECYARLMVERFVPAAADEKLALYYFQGCPYCIRVQRTIEQLGIEVEMRDIFADPKYRGELIEARGRTTVPVLHCTAPDESVRWMPESRDIIHYLRSKFG